MISSGQMHVLVALTLVGSIESGGERAEIDAYAECREYAEEVSAESETEGDDEGCTAGSCQCRADAGGPGLSLLFCGLVLAVRRGRRRSSLAARTRR